MRSFTLWFAAALVTACSAGTAGDDDDDDDGAGAAAGSGATAGFGGTAGSGGTGVGAGGTGGTGASGGDPKLFPLSVGYQWTYQVQAVGAGSVCSPGSHSSSVVGSELVDGRTAFEMSAWCTGVGGTDFYAPGTGDEVLFYYDGQWLTLIDPNLTEGHSWPYFNTSYTWRQESSVTVPAGTFSDCWRAEQNVSYTAYLTYCRGVGLVRSYSEDLVGSGWDAQLSAVNF